MGMNYAFTVEEEAFRDDLRQFLAQEFPPDHWRLQNDREEGAEGTPEFQRAFSKKLAARGWLTMHWPKQYGGLEASHMQQMIFTAEMNYAMAPNGGMGVWMAGPTLMHHGNEAQKAKHLAAIASGDEVWCQGFSEPGSGSDLASLQARAVLDGDDYVVNGQKIWTSGAHTADWCMLLVRTDPDAPKHRGISYLLMDMKSPGVQLRPLINMLGSHAFNELFLEDVRIPRANLVGEEHRGWYVATTTLDFERSGIGRIMWGQRLLEEMRAYIQEHSAVRTPTLRAKITDCWIGVELAKLLAYRVTWQQQQETVPNYEASMSKMFGSQALQQIAQVGVNMVGPWGALRRDSPGDPVLYGALAEAYMATLSYTIAGGTSEIQRNIIATRGLGMPRD